MPLRRGYSLRSPSRRRSTHWGFGPGDNAVNAITGDGVTFLGSGIILSTETQATIVRLRGSLVAYLTATSAANDGFHCAIGVGLVSDEAFAVGVASIPGPLTEADNEIWMYHRFFDIHSPTATLASADVSQSVAFEVDSKAMRKWDDDKTLVAMLEVEEASVAIAAVWFDSRVLLKFT